MVRKFLKDIGGNYAIATVIAMAPIMGRLALSIDLALDLDPTKTVQKKQIDALTRLRVAIALPQG